jgi:hypothetical protein
MRPETTVGSVVFYITDLTWWGAPALDDVGATTFVGAAHSRMRILVRELLKFCP